MGYIKGFLDYGEYSGCWVILRFVSKSVLFLLNSRKEKDKNTWDPN